MTTATLDILTDQELDALFVVEVEGWRQMTEGLFWSEEKQRAGILRDSALHDVRLKMRLPCDGGILLAYCADANAVLPHLAKWHTEIELVSEWPLPWQVLVSDDEHGYGGRALTMPRAAVLALLRATRKSDEPISPP